jgi:primary-amine oxidase
LTNLATSYVLLAPWNFNDHDVSMESRNSVLLNGEGNWVIEEAVKPPQCVPSTPPPLEYHGTIVFGEDGSPVEDDSPEYAEMIGESERSGR